MRLGKEKGCYRLWVALSEDVYCAFEDAFVVFDGNGDDVEIGTVR